MPDTKTVQRQQRLKRYAEELPMLRERRALAIARGEGEAYVRRLEKMVAHREQRLKDGWPDQH